MALILSAATGNFNAGATWVGGVVPTVGDEARAATGHTVTITANVTCDEVSNAGTGIFTLNDGVTLTANVTSKSTTVTRNCLQFTAASPATASIVGNVTGGTVSSAVAAANTSTGTLSITGNIVSGSASDARGAANNSTGVLYVTGNVTSTGTDSILNGSTGTINVTGNVTGGTTTNANALRNSGTGVINVTGNSTGGTGAGTNGISIGGGTGTLTGNSLGGGNGTAYGVSVTTGTATIIGNCTGGSVGPGANLGSTGTLNVKRAVGNSYGPGNTSGLSPTVGANNAGVGVIQIEELEFGTNGMSPVSGTGIRLKKASTNVAVFNYVDAGSAKTLIDATQNASMPAATDVRNGVSYASGALTGSAFIPLASSVASGVPVDATTGTATLTAADVRAAIGLATANLDTQLAAIPTAVTNANAVWDELMSNHTTSGTYGGRIVRATNANNELQINAQNHASANVHQFQAAVIQSAAFATSAVTLFTGAMRTELTPELTEITEVHAIHGLDIANALTVTPTSRTAGAITQSISGDGTTNTVVTRV